MPDLNSLSAIKNWVIGGLLSLVFVLLAGYASDNRRRIELGEEGHRNHSAAIEQAISRVSRLEEAYDAGSKRLERIENKIDRLGP